MLNIDPNKVANQRKRSSLKQKALFPEGMTYDEYMAQKNKKLQWDTKAEEIEIVKEGQEGKINDDGSHKVVIKHHVTLLIYSLKYIQPVTNEITELPKEENEIPEAEEVEVIKEIEVKFDEHLSIYIKIYLPDLNFDNKRKQSIKDEFSLVKDLLKVKIIDDELDTTDDQEETLKNTHKNESVAKEEDEDSD